MVANDISELFDTLREAEKLGLKTDAMQLRAVEEKGIYHFGRRCIERSGRYPLELTKLSRLNENNVCSACASFMNLDGSGSRTISSAKDIVNAYKVLDELTKTGSCPTLENLEAVEKVTRFSENADISTSPSLVKWVKSRKEWFDTSVDKIYIQHQEELKRLFDTMVFEAAYKTERWEYPGSISDQAYESICDAIRELSDKLRQNAIKLIIPLRMDYLSPSVIPNQWCRSRILERLYARPSGYMVLPLSYSKVLSSGACIYADGPTDDATLEVMKTLQKDGGEYRTLEDAYKAASKI